MKLRFVLLFAALTLIASACNFTLAEDVTPPPGYVAPTPLPTLVLSPSQAPSVENGRLIYAEKCAACHGETGLGDGEQGIQLNVTVPAFGLPELARPKTPATWFTTVTRGRIDRFMPPFASLNDQERWDVVAYAMTLHMTEDGINRGREIFETNCADCSTEFFQDQSRMAALTGIDLARIVRQGNESVPAFGAELSEDDLWAVTSYLRTLSFDLSTDLAQAGTATPEAASVNPTPSSEGTAAGTEQASTVVASEGPGLITGTVENQTGEDLPAGFKVTLRGFDHDADPSAGPQEVISQEAAVDQNGAYRFENIEMPASRIFLTEVEVDGIQVQSDYAIAEEGTTSLTIPPLVLYGMTEDTSLLVVDEVRLFLEYNGAEVQVFGVYSFRNPSDKTIVVELKDGTEIPFIQNPEGTTSQGYEALQDSEPFVNTDEGLAIPPSAGSYGLIAYTTLPQQNEFEIAQPFVLPVSNLTVFLPEGVNAQSTTLIDEGLQTIQSFNFQVYSTANVAAGDTVRFTVSGIPEETTAAASEPATVNTNRNLLVGAGIIGLALILAGGWLYLRDRGGVEEEDEEERQEFDSSEDVLDAIVALDDLHRAKKISDEAYQNRRAELKDILKGMI
jgi:mono/diheme cytochrome c family protein